MSISISTASTDIKPTNSYAVMAGYGTTTPRLATGTKNPVQARCVVMWDDGYPNAIVTADTLGWPRYLNQAIRADIAGLTSWSNSDFVLLSTHTHNSAALKDTLEPFISYGLTNTSQMTAYGTAMRTKIVNLVQSALNATKIPCTLDYHVTSQNWSYNREGLSHAETAVPVLVARNSNGVPKAILFSYGCHPVAAGSQTKWDGDFPSGAAAAIESAFPGCTALFVPGAAGDQDPSGSRGWALRDQLGAQLGSAVVAAANSSGRTITGPIQTSYADTNLPLDITDTPSNLAQVRAAYQSRAANGSLPIGYIRHANTMIAQIDAHSFATTVPIPVQVWKLQGGPQLQIAFVGSELVSGYAEYFRYRYGGTDALMIGGYANETPCYVPSNELLPYIRSGGSYAGGWDTDFPGIAGGSLVYYARLGHFRAGTNGVEDGLISAIDAQLS